LVTTRITPGALEAFSENLEAVMTLVLRSDSRSAVEISRSEEPPVCPREGASSPRTGMTTLIAQSAAKNQFCVFMAVALLRLIGVCTVVMSPRRSQKPVLKLSRMPTILTHALAGIAIAQALAPCDRRTEISFIAAACAMLPDADVLGFSFGIDYGDLLGHRGLTHSLFFAALIAGVATLLLGHAASG